MEWVIEKIEMCGYRLAPVSHPSGGALNNQLQDLHNRDSAAGSLRACRRSRDHSREETHRARRLSKMV